MLCSISDLCWVGYPGGLRSGCPGQTGQELHRPVSSTSRYSTVYTNNYNIADILNPIQRGQGSLNPNQPGQGPLLDLIFRIVIDLAALFIKWKNSIKIKINRYKIEKYLSVCTLHSTSFQIL